MGKIIVHEETTKNPISLAGKCAGLCWGGNTANQEKNYKRGLECIKSGHGRVMEYPQVYLTIDGYSARVMRELYTHLAGSPTRLQSSTRYIQYGDFPYVTPPAIAKDAHAKECYDWVMYQISETYKDLEACGVPREDIGMILPLGMETKVVMRTNLRQLIDMSHQRLCSRAYWEFRELMADLMDALSAYSEEWEYLVKNYFKPKCEVTGFCTESKCCGRKPRKDQVEQEKEVIAEMQPAIAIPGFRESLSKLIRSYLT